MTALLLLLTISAGLRAQSAPFYPACAQDSKRLCPNRYNGPLLSCLLSRAGQLTEPCRGLIIVLQPCAAELAALCPDAAPGRGQLLDCLNGRAAELSPECKKAVDRINYAARHGGPPALPNAAPPGS